MAIPLTLTRFGIAYQLYLIDILLIVVLFCGLTFMIGYFGKEQHAKKHDIEMHTPPSPAGGFMVRVSSNSSVGGSSSQSSNVGKTFKTQKERVSYDFVNLSFPLPFPHRFPSPAGEFMVRVSRNPFHLVGFRV